jgi:hypothetical protein
VFFIKKEEQMMKSTRRMNSLAKKINELFLRIDSQDWVKAEAQIHADTISYHRSCARLGLKHSQETKDKIRAALQGKKFAKVVCSHCGRTGSGPAMRRWHFDACTHAAPSGANALANIPASKGDSDAA